MARTKSVAPEALAALGAEALAQVLIAHADSDPVLRKKLVMLLASTEGPGKLAAEIDKRIKTIGRSRSFVDWEKRKLLVQELDHLRATIATRLAAQDRERAIELLWDFLGIADTVLTRMGDGIGAVEEIFGAAMEDLGRLSATPPPRNPETLARRVLAYCERDGFGSTDALIRHMGEALGVAGRTEIRRATEAALKAVPRSAQPRDWQGDAKRRHFAFRLALLADLENDADAFIAAIHGGGMEGTHGLDVAERLIAANRPAEALTWLDKPRQRFEGDRLRMVPTPICGSRRLRQWDARTTRNRYAGATSSGLSAPSICGPISSACQISRISRPSKRRSRWLPATSRPNEPWRS